MNKELRKYKARIFGELYPLVSDKDEQFVLEVIYKVDALMKDVAEKSKSTDTKKIAVLAALKAVEELLNLQQALHEEQNHSDKILTLLSEENMRV